MTSEPTNTTIAITGAKVVWSDVDPATGLLDPKSVREKITERTKAIMLVHYAGMCVIWTSSIRSLRRLAFRY
jgi:dTDP-4-amino-4,6-dideoxygalactose transaminase